MELSCLKLKKLLYLRKKLAKPEKQKRFFKKVLPNFGITADQFACFFKI